jgi:hypothetical protein
VLSQVHDGQERVIVYYRKTLNKVERNYCVTRRELLVIVRTLEHFHKYLYREEFHLLTDPSALTWLMSFTNLEGQTAGCPGPTRIKLYFRTSSMQNTKMPMLSQDGPVKKNERIVTRSSYWQT